MGQPGYCCRALTLWPAFLWFAVQGDTVRLFELGDVLTVPAELIDTADVIGWPPQIGVQTTITISADRDGASAWTSTPWASTATGLSVRTRLKRPIGSRFSARAALNVPIQTTSLMSYVTGTVRRIEMASVVPPPAPGDPAEPGASDEPWTLTETPVAPVRFRLDPGQNRSEITDRGILVHLELFTPRCRCLDVAGLHDPEALGYARRHLTAVAEDHEAETTDYVCPETGLHWIRHRRTRTRSPEESAGARLHEPMILTRLPVD
jgi:hypothetical protein